MKRLLRLAPSEKLPSLLPRTRGMQAPAVQAVLAAWQGKDWQWYGEEEMARVAVEVCRREFEKHRDHLGVITGEFPPDPHNGGTPAA